MEELIVSKEELIQLFENQVIEDTGRGWPDHRDTFGFGRPRLPGRRPGTRLVEGHWPRRISADH